MNILILGDFYPKDIDSFLFLPKNDFCVANLECCVTNSTDKISKDGPSLKIDENIEIFKNIKIDLFGLANNHILDYGMHGLNDTCSFLRNNNYHWCGLNSTKNYFIKKFGDVNVGFYFVTEHQYNTLFCSKPPINVLDEFNTFQEIEKAKKKCDFLIVLFHGGKEFYEYPTPFQMKICHKFVDCGATLVVCQHSHCIGCMEDYKNSKIIYGQGNFAFPFSTNKMFQSGLILNFIFDDKKHFSLELLPIKHQEPGVIRFANEEEKKFILEEFDKKSKKLIEFSCPELYQKLITEKGTNMLYKLFNINKYLCYFDDKYFRNKYLVHYLKKHRKYVLYLYNYFNCETHSEFITKILEKEIVKFNEKNMSNR